MPKITKKTLLHDALKEGPAVAKVFQSLDMRCASCSGQHAETVEWAAVTHGVDAADLVKRLNSGA